MYAEVFIRLGDELSEVSEADLNNLEMFVIELYSPAQQKVLPTSLARMRLENFKSSADDDLRKLPPSSSALCEHSKRASFQSGFLWKEAVENLNIYPMLVFGIGTVTVINNCTEMANRDISCNYQKIHHHMQVLQTKMLIT